MALTRTRFASEYPTDLEGRNVTFDKQLRTDLVKLKAVDFLYLLVLPWRSKTTEF